MIVLAVLRAIKFNNDFRPVACEVVNVATDWRLTAKMQTCLFEFTKRSPEQPLASVVFLRNERARLDVIKVPHPPRRRPLGFAAATSPRWGRWDRAQHIGTRAAGSLQF